MQKTTFPVKLNIPESRMPWYRVLQTGVNIFLFFGIAVVAIPVCLGYRINWQAHSITQTGLIELDGRETNLSMQIYVNDVLQSTALPYRQNWVFPGNYTLRVERSGYQTWEKDIEVEANKRSTYDSILLIYNQPQTVSVPAGVTAATIRNNGQPSDSIQVVNENELFVQDKYETSTSQNIVSARWYTDRDHVVFQAGTQLMLYDLTSQTTQALTTFSTKEPVPYIFQNGGRVLIYDDNGLKAISLFEPLSLIDRLGVGR